MEFGNALHGPAEVMLFGDKKYGRYNWQRGLPHTQIVDSLLRHTTAWINGEDRDRETGLRHTDHMVVNVLMLAWNVINRPEFDDRIKEKDDV